MTAKTTPPKPSTPKTRARIKLLARQLAEQKRRLSREMGR